MDMATQVMRHLAGMLQPLLEHDEDDLGRGDYVERSMYSLNNETVANINVNNDKWSVTVAPSAAPMQSAGTDITDESMMTRGPGEIPWWWTAIFILAFFGLVCASMTIRELCARWCGGACGPTSYWPQDTWPHSRHSIRHRIGNDTSMTSEDRREAKLQKQRQERRLWYQYYLKPYTVVLTEGDFVTDDKLEGTSLENEEVPDLEMGTETSTTKDTEASDKEADLNNEDVDVALVTVDLESGDKEQTAEKDPESTETTATPTGLCMNASAFDDNTRTMCLWDPHDSCYRSFEASCTICYEDYEVGDVLVHSATNEDEEYCRHVFHRDCMLAWLEKGKKRCPICRHWFVPSVRIHDQMKDAHVATNPDSLRHLYDDRTMEAFASLNGEEDESTSSNSYSGDMDDVEAGANADPLRGDANMHHHHHHNHTDNHRGDANMNHSHNYQTPPPNANPFLQSRYRPAASLADLARHAQLTLYGPDATTPTPTFPAAQPHHHHRQATWDPASHAMGTLPTPIPPLREHSEGFLVASTPARDPASLAMALPQGDVADDLSDGQVATPDSSHHRRRHTSPAELLNYQADIRSWAMPDEAVRV